MKITDYLGSFLSELQNKEQGSFHRVVRAGVKSAIAGMIWWYTWPVAVGIFLITTHTADKSFMFFVSTAGWFIVLYLLVSLLFWWGEKRYLPKRGIRF